MLYIDRALETSYIVAGVATFDQVPVEVSVLDNVRAAALGPSDTALLSTAEAALLPDTHRIDPHFGIWSSESGAIAMRTMVRPDEVEEASILLYDVSGTAELLARATIWPFYGIRASQWTTEPDGSSAISIVDGLSALEPVETGYGEDLVRAWFILTEQPVVTHLLAVPAATSAANLVGLQELLSNALAAGNEIRRDVRKALLADSGVDGDRLVSFLAGLRYELDDRARASAYSLLARGSGGTRYPLIREIPWWTLTDESDQLSPETEIDIST